MKELQNSTLRDVQEERKDLSELANEIGVNDNIKEDEISKSDLILQDRLNEQEILGAEEIGNNARVSELKHILTEREILKAIEYSNPNFSKGRIWQTNTPQSIMALELRRRGYNVTAKPQNSGTEDINKIYQMWKNPKIIRMSGDGREDIERNMSNWGNGARAQVAVTWKGTNIAHAFIAEQVNGKTRFYDPQAGYKDVTGYFNNVKPGSVTLTRIDNLEPNGRLDNYVEELKRDKQQPKSKQQQSQQPRLRPLPQQQINPRQNKENDSVELKRLQETQQLKEIQTALDGCNPNFSKNKREWSENCQRCVPTYELRRRGYDVTAQPAPLGVKDYLSQSPFSVWQNPKVIRCKDNGVTDIEKNMAKWGDGARAQIVVVWKNGSMGHTFVAEQVNGKTRYYDPQDPSRDASQFFKNVRPGSVQICRTDNLKLNPNLMRQCYV